MRLAVSGRIIPTSWNRPDAYRIASEQGNRHALQLEQTRPLAQAQAASFTIGDKGDLFLVDATAGAATVTLPLAAKAARRRITVKKTDASANAVTVDGNGAETIDGAANYALAAQYNKVTVQSDGTQWWIV